MHIPYKPYHTKRTHAAGFIKGKKKSLRAGKHITMEKKNVRTVAPRVINKRKFSSRSRSLFAIAPVSPLPRERLYSERLCFPPLVRERYGELGSNPAWAWAYDLYFRPFLRSCLAHAKITYVLRVELHEFRDVRFKIVIYYMTRLSSTGSTGHVLSPRFTSD